MNTWKLAIATLITTALAAAGLSHAQTTTPAQPAQAAKSAAKNQYDTNKDGKMSKQEAVAAKQSWEAQFKEADKNKDGGLSMDELKETKHFKTIEQNFAAMDTNKDGKVTIAERQAWGKAQAAKKK